MHLAGIKIEIIVVESISTNESRDEVLRYKDNPDVLVSLQEKPLGKGNAVRAELTATKDDFILMQDVNLEYDVEDFDTPLEPVRKGKQAFVLWQFESF